MMGRNGRILRLCRTEGRRAVSAETVAECVNVAELECKDPAGKQQPSDALLPATRPEQTTRPPQTSP